MHTHSNACTLPFIHTPMHTHSNVYTLQCIHTPMYTMRFALQYAHTKTSFMLKYMLTHIYAHTSTSFIYMRFIFSVFFDFNVLQICPSLSSDFVGIACRSRDYYPLQAPPPTLPWNSPLNFACHTARNFPCLASR
jgi:hypothetical protein